MGELRKTGIGALLQAEQLRLLLDDPEPEPGPNAFRNAHSVLVSDWDLWDASETAHGRGRQPKVPARQGM